MLDFTDIQGNILLGYRFPITRYTFLNINSAQAGRLWLNNIRRWVTTAEDWGPTPPSATLNVAFTYAGLAALGLSQRSLETFPPEFREGALQRAHLLGDTDESDPANWDDGLGSSSRYALIHLLIVIYAVDDEALQQQYDLVLSAAPAGAMNVVYKQDAAWLDGGREHFGFRDDISQPVVLGAGPSEYPGHGTPTSTGSWNRLAAGEFILGQPAQDGAISPMPWPELVSRNGTYLVYRKLHQKVAVFRDYLKHSAAALACDEEWLAAKIVGRWRDGTPTALSPEKNDPELASDPARNNNFRYSSDPKGLRCPLGSHIRRSNPREGLPGGASATEGHRIMRRGMTYGPPLPSGAHEDNRDRGLVFVGACASLRSQFEFMQQQWVNSGGFAGLDTDHKDPLIGDNDGTGVMLIPMNDFPRRIFNMVSFVTTRLGVYLFMPGLQGLKYLSELIEE